MSNDSNRDNDSITNSVFEPCSQGIAANENHQLLTLVEDKVMTASDMESLDAQASIDHLNKCLRMIEDSVNMVFLTALLEANIKKKYK